MMSFGFCPLLWLISPGGVWRSPVPTTTGFTRKARYATVAQPSQLY